LFFQSNFGIVTSACFRLYPKRPKGVVVSLALREAAHLPRFINELARLKREGLLTSVAHVANRARTEATLSFGITRYLENECGFSTEAAAKEAHRALSIVISDEWMSFASDTCSSGQVREALKEIRNKIRHFARLRIITDERLDMGYKLTHSLRFIPFARANAAAISAMRPLHKLALGVPTDVAIENLLWRFGYKNNRASELDQSRCGLLFVNPALPLDGPFVARAVEEMKSVAAGHDHILYITLNVETGTSLTAIINLLFDRGDPEAVERAHRCADALLAYLRAKQLEPYRARADMMDKIVASDPGYWKTIRSLKQVFDPDNIIAPGRYNLP
jgi:4-cresol dehydrogenase (hydroxylating)